MAEFTFACPLCQQHIACDELWSGHQIQCPLCQGAITVPAKEMPSIATAAEANNPFVPKPPTQSSPRLSVSGGAQRPAQTGNRNIPIRNLAPPPSKKKSPVVPIVTTAVALIVLGAGGYFGYQWMQKGTATAASETGKGAGGGQTNSAASQPTPRAGTVKPEERYGVVTP